MPKNYMFVSRYFAVTAKRIVFLLRILACRRPSLIAVRLGHPKAKPSFCNLEGKTNIIHIISQQIWIRKFFGVWRLSLP